MKKALLILITSLTLVYGAADNGAAKSAEKLFNVMNMDSTFDKMMQQMADQRPEMSAAEKDAVIKFFNKYMSYEILKPDLITMYAEVFSEEELNDMIAFYKTPTGQKTISALPVLSQKSGQLAMERIMPHMDEMVKIISDAKEANKDKED
jgi:uncharacterized protein